MTPVAGTKLFALAVLISLVSLTSGCSRFTQAGRQQAAYARYVAKYSHTRVKQQTKFKKIKVPTQPASAPIITAGAVQGPQSVGTTGSSQ